jgi:hypothetical protein
MGVSASVHTGIIAKINLKPSAYTVNITSCAKVDCSNYGKELDSNFCPVCGQDVEFIDIKKYGVVKWDTFMDTREWEDEDALTQPCDYYSERDGFQILTHYEWGNDGIALDPDDGNTATIAELQEHSVKCIAKFEAEHASLIKDAQEFFGDRFSYDYGICSFWS